ncbi:ABC transporter ATP-binding protein [Fodinibius sediminis]|uniref:Iron complex transport system ATP-binding protein n=1 Tax=Fodinibius sediminis TaxID=1214077 RepID=A0A521D9V7_9BACT|nr:ATP-binding cassette domain-containing protein [Fodinibius sediminis]SMO68458.1 iron complex transport system ATP-binding protein [Fodinibius sediminis]
MTEPVDEDPILQFRDVTAYRNNTKVMDQFSMTIGRMDHTAIVGPNGSGKSTFIQLLTHQLHPVAPENNAPAPIQVFGRDHWDVTKLRKRIGIISTELEYGIMHNLSYGRLSGLDVAITGFFSSMQLFRHHDISDEMKQTALKKLDLMRASHLKDRMFNRMSAGEARRVLIARALVTSPEVLVLDEPTTALDLVARKTCLQLISDVARQGTTVIIVTHHLEEVLPEIQNVILLENGRAVFSGPKKEVLTSENLSSVYNHPLELFYRNGTPRIELDHS